MAFHMISNAAAIPLPDKAYVYYLHELSLSADEIPNKVQASDEIISDILCNFVPVQNKAINTHFHALKMAYNTKKELKMEVLKQKDRKNYQFTYNIIFSMCNEDENKKKLNREQCIVKAREAIQNKPK